MVITTLTAPIELDSIRLTIESLMRNRASGTFAMTSGIDVNALPSSIASENAVILSTATGSLTGMTQLSYTVIAGRLEIDGLTTSNLPNARRYWLSFGQLCEDIFFGRIPELVGAKAIAVNQSASTLAWTSIGDVSANTELNIITPILIGTETKISSDFFEG